MLTPEYINLLEFNDVVQLYNKLNIDLTADIIDRISAMEDISETAKNEMKILIERSGEEVFYEALEKTSMITAERKQLLKKMFSDMASEDMQGYKELYLYRDKLFKLSERQYRILNEGLRATDRLLKNLTNTIAFRTQQAYVEAIDEAYMQTVTGAYSYTNAISNTVQKLADMGITLKDKAGRNVQLEVAVRRNVLAGIQSTANNINRDIEKELGCDRYEVTAHIGARPTHAEAQGKQYAINKEDSKKYGIGLWSDVSDLWEEYNCRHTYFGIILGISEPVYTDKELNEYKNATVEWNGKKIPYYEATQRQRQLENAIRKQKRTVQILEKAGQDTTTANAKLRTIQKKLNDFCKQTGIDKDYSRTQSTNLLNKVNKKLSLKEKNDKIKKEKQVIKQWKDFKTIDEAKEYVYTNYKDSDIDKIKNVEAINTTFKTLDELQRKYPLNQEIFVRNKTLSNAIANGNYQGININTSQFNKANRKGLFGGNWVQNLNNQIEELKQYLGNPKYKQKSVEKEIKRIEELKKFRCYSISGSHSELESIRATITHEYGHVLADQYFGQINQSRANKDFDFFDTNECWKKCTYVSKVYSKALKNNDIYDISYYASTSQYEFFAECFAKKQMGGNLPDYIDEMLERVLKNGE